MYHLQFIADIHLLTMIQIYPALYLQDMVQQDQNLALLLILQYVVIARGHLFQVRKLLPNQVHKLVLKQVRKLLPNQVHKLVLKQVLKLPLKLVLKQVLKLPLKQVLKQVLKLPLKQVLKLPLKQVLKLPLNQKSSVTKTVIIVIRRIQ